MPLVPSPKPLLTAAQRGISRLIWGRWLFGFGFWEGLGEFRWVPWKTLSETAWDVEKAHPGTRRDLLILWLGLAVHIRYRTTLASSLAWSDQHVDEFVAWLEQNGGT